MADRNISIRVTANVGSYTKSVRSMANQTDRFVESLGRANQASGGVQKQAMMTARNHSMMARGMGVARAQQQRLTHATNWGGRAFKEAGVEVSGMNSALSATRTLALGVASAFTGFLVIHSAIAGLRRAFTSAKESFVGFDQSMTEALAIMGHVSDAMQNDMSAAARKMAKESTFSASEVADGFYYLTLAGLNARSSLEAIPLVTRFAQAGMFDLSRATDLLTDAQSALGMTVRDDAVANLENMTEVADVLVKANTLANASVEQFSEALTNRAAASARILGKDVQETTAVLASFADQGVKGRLAGNQLAIAWRDLQTRGLRNAEIFQRMGVEVFNSAGMMNNTADIIADLENLLMGMSNEMQRATLIQLGFQDRSVQSLLTLIGTSDAIRLYEYEMRKAGGTTEEVAQKQLRSLSAQANIARSHLQDLAITAGYHLVALATTIGQRLMPTIRNLIDIFKAAWDGTAWLRSDVLKTGIGLIAAAFVGVLNVVEPLTRVLAENATVIKGLATAYGLYRLQLLGVSIASRMVAAESAAIASAHAVARAQGIVAAGAMRTYGLALSQTLQTSGPLIGRLRAIGTTLKGINFATVAASARNFALSIGSFLSQPWAKIGVIATAIFSVKDQFDGARNSAKQAAQEVSSAFDLSTVDGLQRAASAAYDNAAAANEVAKGHRNIRGSILGALQVMTPFTKNTVLHDIEALRQSSEEWERLTKMLEGIEVNFGRVRKEIDASDDVIEKAAERLGVDLTKGAELSNEEIKLLIESVTASGIAFSDATAGVGDFSEVTQDELEGVVEAAEQTSEALREVLMSFTDFTDMANSARHEAVDVSKVYSDLYESRLEEAKEAARTLRDDQLNAARDELTRLQRAKQDAAKADKAGWDVRIRAQQDAVKQLQRAGEAVHFDAPDLSDWMTAVEDATTMRNRFAELQGRALDLGAPVAMVDAIKELGPEQGIGLIEDVLSELAAFEGEAAVRLGEALQMDADIDFATTPDAVRREFFDPLREMFDNAEELMGLNEFEARMADRRQKMQDLMSNLDFLGSLEGMDREALQGLASEDDAHLIIAEIRTAVETGEMNTAEAIRLIKESQETTEGLVAEFLAEQSDAAILMNRIDQQGIHKTIQGFIKENDHLSIGDVIWTLEETLGGTEYWEGVDSYLHELRTSVDEIEAQWGTWVSEVQRTPIEVHGSVVLAPQGRRSEHGWSTLDFTSYAQGLLSGGSSSRNADGGYYPHIYSRSDGIRVFNEPEAGGEAYIPLGLNKRGSALKVFDTVAKHFGLSMNEYANGGVYQGGSSIMRGAPPSSSRSMTTRIEVIPVEVPVAQRHETNFNGPINATDVADIKRQAERRRRSANLTGMGGTHYG